MRGGGAMRVAPAVDPMDAAGALLACQARSPQGPPTGGKLTIGQGALSRVVHAMAGLSSPTPHAHCCSATGCTAVMASVHAVEHTTGAGALEKKLGLPNRCAWRA